MKIGASTFIWVSPFSNQTLDLVEKARELGFDILEICVERSQTIDSKSILGRLEKNGLETTICGAFGPDRDASSEDATIRDRAIRSINRCVDIAQQLNSRVVPGPIVLLANGGSSRRLRR
jgi:D-psicose/D-tagatose/L-ribulose 3-epimerase